MKNYSLVSEFIFTGLLLSHETEISLFILFLFMYMIITLGNSAVIMLIYIDFRLHLPMYFFLGNISFLEISIASVVIPELLSTLLSVKKNISFVGCFVQCYLYFLLGTVDFIFLAAMSFDRYVAICSPLHYIRIMSWKTCYYLALMSWLLGLIFVTCPAIIKALLPYCGENRINHFFCDATLLLKLACIDTGLIELIDFFLFFLVIVTSLTVTIVTYTIIVITILRIPSVNSRLTAISTCTSHLFLVILGYGSAIFIYVIPKRCNTISSNKIVSIITVFVTPILSPFIFCLRNHSVQVALMDALFKTKKYFYNFTESRARF